MSYFRNIGNSISQMLNAISGGNPDIPMSARAHYYSNKYLWFMVLEWWINLSFYPLDGKGHCEQAFKSDIEKISEGNIYTLSFMSLFSLLGAGLIMPFTWIYYILKKWR